MDDCLGLLCQACDEGGGRLAQQARHAVRDDVPRVVLKIGTLESTATSRLPLLLAHYHEQYPAVRVELVTSTTDALVEGVFGRQFDAAFVAGRAEGTGLETLAAFDEELVLVAPRAHPAIRSAQDVRTDTIISFPAGCAYRRQLQAWPAAGTVVPEKVLELSSYHAIIACIASGTGIALVPRSVLETGRASDNIAVYPFTDVPFWLPTYLVWRQGEVSPALRALQAEIRLSRPQAPVTGPGRAAG